MKLKIHYFTKSFAIRNPLKFILLRKCPMGLNYYEFFLWLHTLYLLRLNKEFVSSDNGAHANFKMHKYPPTFTDRQYHHRWVQPEAAPCVEEPSSTPRFKLRPTMMLYTPSQDQSHLNVTQPSKNYF